MLRLPKFITRLFRRIDVALLMIISVASIVIAALDFFGAFESVPFFQELNYSVIIIILLSTIGLHIAITSVGQSEFEDRLPAEFAKIVRSLEGVSVEVFPSTVELENYQAERVSAAKKEVCDLSWKEKLGPGFSVKPRLRSHKSYETSIDRASGRIPYREIFVFSDRRRKDKLLRRLKAGKSGYSCRYFIGSNIPRLQFILIDGEEIIFASSSYPKLCAIKHKELGEIFQSYYEELWNAATPIKNGDVIYREELDKIFENEPGSTKGELRY